MAWCHLCGLCKGETGKERTPAGVRSSACRKNPARTSFFLDPLLCGFLSFHTKGRFYLWKAESIGPLYQHGSGQRRTYEMPEHVVQPAMNLLKVIDIEDAASVLRLSDSRNRLLRRIRKFFSSGKNSAILWMGYKLHQGPRFMSQAQVSRLLGQTAHFSLLLNIFQSVAQASTMDTIQYNFKTRVQKSVKKICTLFFVQCPGRLGGAIV